MKMVKRIFAAMLVVMMMLGCAAAEEAALGNFINRGVILSLTQADVDMGLQVVTNIHTADADGENVNIPYLNFTYADPQVTEELYTTVDLMYETGKFDGYDELVMEYFERNYSFAAILLIADEKSEAAAEAEFGEMTVLGENDGYTYMLYQGDVTVHEKDDPAVLEAVRVRVNEMINSIQYQPVIIPEEELEMTDLETVIPNAFPTFTTQDLNGNTVDNSLFAKADLTVLNIWGTTCYPCISEMPELQAWSEEMPENVQMVGLVLDVSIGDAETIEMAQMICEATGVTYTNLMLSEDLYEFASGIIFTPTTIFVDGNGSIVGEPVTGAYVDAYKEFVESYLAK